MSNQFISQQCLLLYTNINRLFAQDNLLKYSKGVKRMATTSSIMSGDEVVEVMRRTLNAGSIATEIAVLVADVGREIPIASAAINALQVVQNKFETARNNKTVLGDLRKRCFYLTKTVVKICRGSPTDLNFEPLEDCLRDAAEVIERCGGRNRFKSVLYANRDRDDFTNVHNKINTLVYDMGLSTSVNIHVSTVLTVVRYNLGVSVISALGKTSVCLWHGFSQYVSNVLRCVVVISAVVCTSLKRLLPIPVQRTWARLTVLHKKCPLVSFLYYL